MFDSSFRAGVIRKEVQRYDRRLHRDIADPEQLERMINTAVRIADSGFQHATFNQHIIKSKPVYQVVEFPYELVLRKLNRNIRVATRVKQTDRNTTIRRVKSLMSEGVPHRVYKLDISSFYESIDIDATWNLLENSKRITRQSVTLANGFLRHCELNGVQGVPRGIGLSSTIAELTMQPFDDYAKSLPEVYFYSRYVDDILIITSTFENESTFIQHLEDELPSGLEFNDAKTRVILFDRRNTASNPPVSGSFEYLGYLVEVSDPARDSDNKIYRRVRLDLSQKKVKRVKTRIIKSLLQFAHDYDFEDLQDRMKILTGNYNIIDYERRLRRNVGLYCNYRQLDGSQSAALPELDKFLRSILCGRAGRTSARIFASLTKDQRRELLTFSFAKSFERKVYYGLSGNRIATLRKCWSYA